MDASIIGSQGVAELLAATVKASSATAHTSPRLGNNMRQQPLSDPFQDQPFAAPEHRGKPRDSDPIPKPPVQRVLVGLALANLCQPWPKATETMARFGRLLRRDGRQLGGLHGGRRVATEIGQLQKPRGAKRSEAELALLGAGSP